MNEALKSYEEALVIPLQDAEEANSLETGNQQGTTPPESGFWPIQIFTRLVYNVYVKFQLDCGPSCYVPQERDMPPILAKTMRSTQKVLRMYNGSLMCPMGAITRSLHNQGADRKYKMSLWLLEMPQSHLLERRHLSNWTIFD